MGKLKKAVVAGVVCYVAYKLGKKYLQENNLTPGDVADSLKARLEDMAKQAVGVVPTTESPRKEGRQVYTFGGEKRMEIVHLAEGITGLYDNKKNYPVEKQVRSYSEVSGKLFVYGEDADYMIHDAPFFINVYVKDEERAEAIALTMGQHYEEEEAAVYRYGSDRKLDMKGLAAKAAAGKVAAEQEEVQSHAPAEEEVSAGTGT